MGSRFAGGVLVVVAAASCSCAREKSPASETAAAVASPGASPRIAPARGADVKGTIKAHKDHAVPEQEYTLLVIEPRTLIARKDLALGDGLVYDATTGAHSETPTAVELAAGQALEYLHYGSEGTEYVRIEGVIYLVDAPEWTSDFDGVPAGMDSPEPIQQQWWVRVAAGAVDGWVEVTPAQIRAKVTGP